MLYLLFVRAEYQRQQGHAHVHSVFHLAKVGGARIGVHFGSDLVDSRQRVQYHHLGRHGLHKVGIDHIRSLHKRSEVEAETTITMLSEIHALPTARIILVPCDSTNGTTHLHVLVSLFRRKSLALDASHVKYVCSVTGQDRI